jgi:hypothetical protein
MNANLLIVGKRMMMILHVLIKHVMIQFHHHLMQVVGYISKLVDLMELIVFRIRQLVKIIQDLQLLLVKR